jgi:inner membrane protein
VPTLLTHGIVGAALVGVAPLRARSARLAVALVALAMLPDADVIGLRLGLPYAHWLGHRGFSHSLAFAAIASAAVALILFPLATTPSWRRVALLLFAAIASHGLLDAATDGGLGVALLAPLSDARFFFPWRPIEVSPLSASAFLGPRGLDVLASEALFVWAPVGLITLALRARGTR